MEATITALVEAADGDAEKGPSTDRTLRGRPRPLSEEVEGVLDQECRTFAAYLVGSAPSAYVRKHYARAALAHGLAFDDGFTRFDRVALAFARTWPVCARSADAYCALFHRRAALRRKLIVLAAILEHAAPTSEAFDRPLPQPVARLALSLFAYGLGFAASLLPGAIILAPASLLCWLAGLFDRHRRPREAG
jgi:hypothetical protein